MLGVRPLPRESYYALLMSSENNETTIRWFIIGHFNCNWWILTDYFYRNQLMPMIRHVILGWPSVIWIIGFFLCKKNLLLIGSWIFNWKKCDSVLREMNLTVPAFWVWKRLNFQPHSNTLLCLVSYFHTEDMVSPKFMTFHWMINLLLIPCIKWADYSNIW